MTFATTETSQQDGRPVFLLQFARSGKTWYYTNADQDIVFNFQTYTAFPIKVDSLIQSGTSTPDDVKLTMPRTVPFCQYLDLLTPSSQILLTLRKTHIIEDPVTGAISVSQTPEDNPVFWVGAYSGLSRPSLSIRELSFTPFALARPGLRLAWESSCPYMLFGAGCSLVASSFQDNISSFVIVDGVTITSSNFASRPDGYYNAGYLEWTLADSSAVERRGIETHIGNTVTMFGTTEGIAGGFSIHAFPGCDRTPQTCTTKFANMANYGGINHLDGRSPFDGNPVF